MKSEYANIRIVCKQPSICIKLKLIKRCARIKNVSQVGNTCLCLWCGSLVVLLLDLTATIEYHMTRYTIMLPHQICKQMILILVYLTANCQSSEVLGTNCCNNCPFLP